MYFTNLNLHTTSNSDRMYQHDKFTVYLVILGRDSYTIQQVETIGDAYLCATNLVGDQVNLTAHRPERICCLTSQVLIFPAFAKLTFAAP